MTGNIDLLIPAAQLNAALQGRNSIRPITHTEIGLAEIKVRASISRHLLQILLQKTDIARILVGFAAAVAVVNQHWAL